MPPDLQLNRFLPYRLNILSKKVSLALATRYQERFGLSIPEWRVFATLGQEQPLSSNDIVERTAMDKAKVSRAVNRLVAAGLLDRQAHPRDQRLLRLSFSPRGRDLYAQVAPEALAWEGQLLSVLTDAERAQLWALMEKLEQRVAEEIPASVSLSDSLD
ncbi:MULTISPECIES: MarR family winged helix-turn-helix transcriptional regulator [Nitrospirillum]|uniref:DNA-binding MarR family transcriptional regulator n=1 Tax=Nitrospirillum amazonense TaxID=28077 RepID=A0A560FBA8_9PROT|nr:MarR family transcriptional regulator [Nitrospirillum amazonense]MEC4593235.1 MarR family transcriptional regulator [Nitrospirillum amazonense]TWB18898.1 DNA-binding MarR family transcriptional regulator [Nitrospirillum amazonense]